MYGLGIPTTSVIGGPFGRGGNVNLMAADDALRRQLRFSWVLQIIGATLFGVAFFIRAFIYGLEPTTWLFAVGGVGIAGVAVWTRRRMNDLD